MKKPPRRSKTAGLLCWAAAAVSASLSTPFLAAANTIPYECNLSGTSTSDLVGCPGGGGGGYLTSVSSIKGLGLCAGSDYCGANANTSAAIAPIEAWNICRWVDNNSSTQVFVPFKSSIEWTKFLAAAPDLLNGSIHLIHCAVPYSDNGAPATTAVMPPFGGCTQINVNNPNVYGRTGVSLSPDPAVAGPNFTCHSGSTSMMSLLQWQAGDLDATPPGVLTWNTKFRYSPDLILSTNTPVVEEGSPITISWYIEPFVPGATLSCSVSPAGWGPDASGFPRSGSTTIVLWTPTTFTLTCSEAPVPLLTSVASTSASTVPPWCCADDGKDGDDQADDSTE
ncbi:MAG: hypothetical protein HY053_03135 [Proteobacteria bacterium]|nr:hypothetical protein [Pseudomonadota bacterium]